MRGPSFIGAVLFLAACSACAATTRAVAVDRYDVRLVVLADGSMDVSETIAARALNPDARFVRDIARERIDEIFDVQASADGMPLTGRAGDLRFSRSRSLRVRWNPGAPNQAHVLHLHYRVAGALEAQERRGLLNWPVLPVNRSYSVAAARISVAAPRGGVFTAGPFINDEQMGKGPDGTDATAELHEIAAQQPLTMTGELDLGSLSMAEPEWQTNAYQAWRLMPAFLSGGACLIAIAIAVVVMIRLQYRTPGPPADEPIETVDLCSVPPTLANAVLSGRLTTTGWSRFATLLSLSQREMVTSPEKRTSALSAHEQVLLDEMWLRHAPGAAASLGDSRAVVQRTRRRVDRAIGGDLVRAGLADHAHLAVRRGLMQTGWVAIAFAVVIGLMIDLLLSRFGIWPFAIPVSLLVMGALFLWAARYIPFLSVRGAYLRRQWQSRFRDLREAAASGRVTATEFERCLPVMVACGAGAEWAAAWERVAPGGASERLVLLRQYTSRL